MWLIDSGLRLGEGLELQEIGNEGVAKISSSLISQSVPTHAEKSMGMEISLSQSNEVLMRLKAMWEI